MKPFDFLRNRAETPQADTLLDLNAIVIGDDRPIELTGVKNVDDARRYHIAWNAALEAGELVMAAEFANLADLSLDGRTDRPDLPLDAQTAVASLKQHFTKAA